jgi:hypothetical protein
MAQEPFLECGVYGSSTAGLRDAKSAFVLEVNRPIDKHCIPLVIYSFTEY